MKMYKIRAFQVALMVKNPLVYAGDAGSTLGSERSPGVGDGNPLQYSCLENSMDKGAWWGHKESDMTEYMRKLNSCSKNSMIIYLYRIYNLQGNMQTQAKCQDSGLCSSCC